MGKRRIRHGGRHKRVELNNDFQESDEAYEQILIVNEALEQFARVDPAKAELVKLRYFAGMSLTEAAAALGVSRATASRHWTFAKAWLYRAMNDPGDE